MSSFRRIFHPTKEEKIEDLETVLKLHQDNLYHCSTCANHFLTDMPGFVTDYGSCRLNSPIFAEKVCGLRDIECPYYVEDVTKVDRIKGLLKELKGENDEENR